MTSWHEANLWELTGSSWVLPVSGTVSKGFAYVFCLYSHLPAIYFMWQSEPSFWSIYQIKLLYCSNHSTAPHFTEHKSQTPLSGLQGLVWAASCPLWDSLTPSCTFSTAPNSLHSSSICLSAPRTCQTCPHLRTFAHTDPSPTFFQIFL